MGTGVSRGLEGGWKPETRRDLPSLWQMNKKYAPPRSRCSWKHTTEEREPT